MMVPFPANLLKSRPQFFAIKKGLFLFNER